MELRCSIEMIDANLAEIRRLREESPAQHDQAVIERVRKEFDDAELMAIAERLRLAPIFSGGIAS